MSTLHVNLAATFTSRRFSCVSLLSNDKQQCCESNFLQAWYQVYTLSGQFRDALALLRLCTHASEQQNSFKISTT